MSATSPSPTIGDLLVALRRSWLAVALLVVVAASAGYVVADRAGTAYTASAQLATGSGDALVGVFGRPVPGTAIAAADVALLAESTVVAARTADELDLPLEALDDVRADVGEDRVAPTVTVTVRAEDARTAVDAANAIALATIDEHAGIVRRALDDAVVALERSLTDVTVTPDSAQQLQRRLDELRVEREAVRSPLAVAVTAVDAAAAGAQPTEVALLAGMLALLVGAAVAYLRLSYVSAASARVPADVVGLADKESTGRPWGRRDIG